MTKEITVIKSWEQVTLTQFNEISRLLDEEKDRTKAAQKVVEYLYDIDPLSIPYTTYIHLLNALNDMLASDIKSCKLTSDMTYHLNGREYTLDTNVAAFSTAQYIDFTNFAKKPLSAIDMLSCVLLPKGHKYLDGYDVDEAKHDIGSMPVALAFGISNFFVNWSRRSITTFLRSLSSMMEKEPRNRAKVEQMKRKVEELDKAMASFLSY